MNPDTPPPLAAQPRTESSARVRFVLALLLVVALIALAVVWRVTPLARLADPSVVADYRQHVRDLPFKPVIVVASFMVASLFAAPATLMIGVTLLLFEPLLGAPYAWLGMMAAACLDFAIARVTARDVVERWLAKRSGSWFDVASGRLQRRGLVAVMLMRLTPIPFTLQNVMAGASRIGFADFMGGTALGVVPVIALMAGVTTEFDAWLEHPDRSRLVWLAAALVAAIGIGWMLRRWAARRALER